MNSTNLKQIDGGKNIISGDISSVFSYQLQDEAYKPLTIDGTAVVTLTLKSDRLPYMREEVATVDGVVSFTLPVLKSGSYQISIEIDGYIFTSSSDTYILVEPNLGEGILETVGPLTLEDYLGDYAKKADVPTITGLATEGYVDATIADSIGAIAVPDLSGLATETYVNDTVADSIGAITAPDLTGLATETYVNTQIGAIAIPEPIDTSSFLTKPLSEPIVNTDPATKSYVDSEISAIPTGGGEEWVIISQGENDNIRLYLNDWLNSNNFKKIKLMYSVAGHPGYLTGFDVFLNNYTYSILADIQNQVTPLESLAPDLGSLPLHFNCSNAVFELEFIRFEPANLYNLETRLSNQGLLDFKVRTNNKLNLVAGGDSTPNYVYTPNFNTYFEMSNNIYFRTGNYAWNVYQLTTRWTILGLMR